jgi:hypothetical protein
VVRSFHCLASATIFPGPDLLRGRRRPGLARESPPAKTAAASRHRFSLLRPRPRRHLPPSASPSSLRRPRPRRSGATGQLPSASTASRPPPLTTTQAALPPRPADACRWADPLSIGFRKPLYYKRKQDRINYRAAHLHWPKAQPSTSTRVRRRPLQSARVSLLAATPAANQDRASASYPS